MVNRVTFTQSQITPLGIVSRSHGFVYVNLPKCACQTIRINLFRYWSGIACDAKNLDHRFRLSPLIFTGERLSKDPAAFALLVESSFTFTVVRNPYSRILSAYLNKFVQNTRHKRELCQQLGKNPKRDYTFKDFLQMVRDVPPEFADRHWRPMSLIAMPEVIRYGYIGSVEDLKGSLEFIRGRLNESFGFDAERRYHSTGAVGKLDEFYDRDTISLIAQIYAADFRIFGYDTDFGRCSEPPSGLQCQPASLLGNASARDAIVRAESASVHCAAAARFYASQLDSAAHLRR